MINPDFETLLKHSNKILIGVSGGADSMALLHLIVQKREKLNKDFKVLHVNHQVNAESAVWAQTVQDYCDKVSMPCEVVCIDVAKWGKNFEQAARRGRYDAFAKQEGYDTIMLAHHSDDQVETFFLKLFRGSGPKGLRCMTHSSECWFDKSKTVVRPLLDYTKEYLENYAREHNVPWIVDPSNSDTSYDRNWIRAILVPMLKARNEIADVNIRKVAAIQGESYDLMTDLAKIDFDAAKTVNGNLDVTKLKRLSKPRLKNLIMFICNERNLTDVSIHHVETFADGLLRSNGDSKTEMRLRNFLMYKTGNVLVI